MKDLILLCDYLHKHKTTLAATLCGALAGALIGVLAYYNNWLG